ncbi:hypothetical protein AXK12_00805 [Cephaloticoccus capnophilus]|uniref:Uncharacterized protein n=1 Tax=Cephaloticoccus capnophilus TaxID=1548208 RepID=A0A139STP6_9BACT|nr:hypothetical protein [Cephaloticoccus capnophilus]KXU37935.1 hypothetical protein AXK12_00805 [Cephaloticoccus capnophilus]
MKKWLYLIVPTVMLVVFTFFYLSQSKELEQQEIARKERVERERKEEEAKRAVIEEKARQDAAARAAEREAEAAQKEADRIAKWEAEGRDIQDATDAFNAEADRISKDISAKEIQLDTLRKQKEQLNTDVLNAAKRVELAQIAKRNAELEIQRKAELMLRRVESSAVAQMPAAQQAGSGTRRR